MLASLVLVPACAALLAAPIRAQQALAERARAALGAWSEAAPLEGRGRAHAAGLDGEQRVVLAADGRYRFEFASALPEASGFDGTHAWTRDRSGLESVLELEEAERSKLFAWVLSGHWSTASELDLATLPIEAGQAPRLELVLRGTPMAMTLTLDAATLLPAELVYLDDSDPLTWTFADFHEVGGRRLPRRWTLAGAGVHESYAIEAWTPLPAGAEPFGASGVRPDDIHFDPEVEPELDVERVASGHLLVEPWVEGESVGLFIFDTGAGALTIDPAVADELGLEELGEVVAVGVGGHTTASFRRGTRFELGPVTLTDPLYVELDLAFLEPLFGCKVAGIVGYDLLARCVVEIETRRPALALHDPARYVLSGARWQDLVLNQNTPCTRARFEGEREGLFRIDTGANGTLVFHAPAARALGLLEGRALSSSLSGGVGGNSDTRAGVLAWFELAGHRFEQPQVQFSLAEHGAFADRYTTGNIGQDFLAPFRMVLDYPNDRLAFVELAK